MGIMTFLPVFFLSVISVREAREAYFRSSAGTKESKKFESLMDSVSDDDVPVLICYKGAAQMLKAKNAVNPISKLSFFKRGKMLIEQGLMKDTTCVESHFIRFTIQHNLPGFLGYNQNLNMDSTMIADALPEMSDNDLKVKITAYYKQLKIGRKSE